MVRGKEKVLRRPKVRKGNGSFERKTAYKPRATDQKPTREITSFTNDIK
jgi:stalled ribosome alternative rescue factor ArfA